MDISKALQAGLIDANKDKINSKNHVSYSEMKQRVINVTKKSE